MRKADPVSVYLKLGTLRGPIFLHRTPKYLRFVLRGVNWDSLDALDQLDDTPSVDERIIAAIKSGDDGRVFWHGTTKGGRRTGGVWITATYDTLTNPPPDEVMRDTQRWREWCLNRAGAVA